MNIGWRGGVHAQTCGHYVHLDCLALYIESLKVCWFIWVMTYFSLTSLQTQSQSQSIRVGDGEFWCPTCRNLSNTALPIISDGGGAMVLAPPSDPYKLIKWIFHVMETRPIAPVRSTHLLLGGQRYFSCQDYGKLEGGNEHCDGEPHQSSVS